jgi:hypothetical protein
MMALLIWKDWRMSTTPSNRNQELLEKGVSGSGKIDE